MYSQHFWPPLEFVKTALDSQHSLTNTVEAKQIAINSVSADARKTAPASELAQPSIELLQRRARVASKEFSNDWHEGRLIHIESDGVVFGVLLNRQVKRQQWIGWCAASETGWASNFDVLLEPEDDPFEPMFGVIQTWNSVTIELTPSVQAKVVGEISALRLEAIRTVEQEYVLETRSSITVEPGRIALRVTGNKFLVLTGTPLSEQDERHEYQIAYRSAVARLMAKQLTQKLAQNSVLAAKKLSGLQRVKALFDIAWIARSAVIATTVSVAAYFFVANINIVHMGDDDFVRFRSAAPSVLKRVDLRMQIKPLSDVNDVNQLILNSGCEIVSGPDAQGFYSLKSRDVVASKTALAQSTLVLQITVP